LRRVIVSEVKLYYWDEENNRICRALGKCKSGVWYTRMVLATDFDLLAQRERQLRKALEECEDYFDNRADVVDGSYGEPAPNPEMRMLEVVRAALYKHKAAS
jgi:hypothetical protein